MDERMKEGNKKNPAIRPVVANEAPVSHPATVTQKRGPARGPVSPGPGDAKSGGPVTPR